MKRLFSSNKHPNAHGSYTAARSGRPPSPPPDIYAGYVDNNAGALGSNFFSTTGALPNQLQPPPVNGTNSANGHHVSVNGEDASIYGGSTLGRSSSVGDVGFNDIPLPPSAPVTAHASAGAGTSQYPPASIAPYSPGFSASSGPFPPRQPPPPANMQPIQHQHQALPTRTRKLIHPASSGLQAVHEQRAAVPHNQYQQRVVHTNVTAEDIRETTYMLRQLYKMELQIYGERYAIHRDDKTRREERRRKVDLLREEIEDIVHTWSITDSAGWTSEEQQHVQYSLDIISSLRTMGQEAEV